MKLANLALILSVAILAHCNLDLPPCNFEDIGKLYCVDNTKMLCSWNLQYRVVMICNDLECNIDNDGQSVCNDDIPEYFQFIYPEFYNKWRCCK